MDMNGIPPEVLQQLIGLGVMDDKQGLLRGQMAQAEALRFQPMAQGRQVGGMFKAANPLEMLAGGIGQSMGARQMQGIQGQQNQLLDQQTAGRNAYGGLLGKFLGGGQQTGTPDSTAGQLPVQPAAGGMPEMTRQQLIADILRKKAAGGTSMPGPMGGMPQNMMGAY